MAIEQFVGAGVLGLVSGTIAGVIAYKQATKVAATQGETSVVVKKLENDGALHGFFHEDVKAAREELRAERAAHIELIEKAAHCTAENKRLSECLEEAEKERDEFKKERDEWKAKWEVADHENRNLQTKVLGFEWMQRDPRMLRHRAQKLEKEQNVDN